jgi:hypothetical protein
MSNTSHSKQLNEKSDLIYFTTWADLGGADPAPAPPPYWAIRKKNCIEIVRPICLRPPLLGEAAPPPLSVKFAVRLMFLLSQYTAFRKRLENGPNQLIISHPPSPPLTKSALPGRTASRQAILTPKVNCVFYCEMCI